MDLQSILQISILLGMVHHQQHGRLTGSMVKSLGLVSSAKQYRDWDASNPRIEIYALVGLTLPGGMEIELEYRRSVENSYQAFAAAAIQDSKNLDL